MVAKAKTCKLSKLVRVEAVQVLCNAVGSAVCELECMVSL